MLEAINFLPKAGKGLIKKIKNAPMAGQFSVCFYYSYCSTVRITTPVSVKPMQRQAIHDHCRYAVKRSKVGADLHSHLLL